MPNRRKLPVGHANVGSQVMDWLGGGGLSLGPVVSVPEVVEVHSEGCGHACVTCGVAFEAGDVSTEVSHVFN